MGGNRAKNSAIFKRVGNSGDPPDDCIWMLDPPPRTLQAPVRAVGLVEEEKVEPNTEANV